MDDSLAISAEPLSAGLPSLKARLRRAERMRKLRAFALVAPLLAFLLLTFVAPILDMLRLSVYDTELSQVWPHIRHAMRDWSDRNKLPPPPVFNALAADLASSYRDRTLATAARRLNYALDNGRSLVFGTARESAKILDRLGRHAHQDRSTLGRTENLGGDRPGERPAHQLFSARRARPEQDRERQ